MGPQPAAGEECSIWDLDIQVEPRVGGYIRANYWEALVFNPPPRMRRVTVTIHSQHIDKDGTPSDFWQDTQAIVADDRSHPGVFPTDVFDPPGYELDRTSSWRGNWRTTVRAPSPTELTDGTRCVTEGDQLVGTYPIR